MPLMIDLDAKEYQELDRMRRCGELGLKYHERKISIDEEWEFKSRYPQAWADAYRARVEQDKAAALATLIAECTAWPTVGNGPVDMQHRTNRLLAAILVKLSEAK